MPDRSRSHEGWTADARGAALSRAARDLEGRRIVLTAARRADDFAAALERRGASIVHAPTMSHVPHVDDPELLTRTRQLIADPPGVVVVTTGIGFRGWLEAARAAGLGGALHDVLAAARIIVRGPKARGAVQGEGLDVAWTASSETAQEIKEHLAAQDMAGVRVAVQHHGAGSDGIDDQLRDGGADVVSLVVYRWGPAPDPVAVEAAVDVVARGDVDCIAFTAAPGVQAFLDAAREAGEFDDVVASLRGGRVLAAAVGDTTAAPLRALGIEPLVPERFRLGALIKVIAGALTRRAELVTPAGRLTFVPPMTGGRDLSVPARVTADKGGNDGDATTVDDTTSCDAPNDPGADWQPHLDGRPLSLPPSSRAILAELARAGGAVVSRDDLLAALPGADGGHSVEVAIARLREGLGAKDAVVTVVKRGYRLEVLA